MRDSAPLENSNSAGGNGTRVFETGRIAGLRVQFVPGHSQLHNQMWICFVAVVSGLETVRSRAAQLLSGPGTDSVAES